MSAKQRKRASPSNGRGQSELISAMLLIAVTLAVALAAYGYFLTRATAEAKTQSIKSALASAKSEILVTLDFHNESSDVNYITYFVAIRNIKSTTYTFFFTVVAAERSGDFIRVINPDIATVYLLTTDDGIYEKQELSPGYLVPTSNIYVDIHRELPSISPLNIKIYNATGTAIPGEQGCEILVRLDVTPPAEGSPMLIVFTMIGNSFYIVDTYKLPGG